MKNLFIFLAGALVLGSGVVYGLNHQTATQQFGAFNPTGGGTYYLQSSINATQTTVALSSFTEPGSNIPYTMTYLNSDIEYATINPTSANTEFISFTGITQNSNGTALLTGVVRGLERSYPYVASSTLAHSAPGQTQLILSAPPQFYNEYASKRNSQVISGQWQFTTLPTSSVACTASTQFCNKAYIDAGLNQGAATSTFSNLGLVWLANSAQVLAGTASSTTGAPLVIPNKNATSTPTASCTGYACIPVAINGKISQLFLDLTQTFTWTGLHTFAAGFISTASSTLVATTTLQGATNLVSPGQLFTSATTTTSWPLAMVIATSTGRATTGSSLLASSTIGFVGFSTGNATNGNSIFVQTSGVVSGFTGLTVGRDYYLQDSGAIGTTVGTLEAYVGTAISTTQLTLKAVPSLQYSGSISTGTAVPSYVRELVINVCGQGPAGAINFCANLVVKNVGVTSASSQQVDYGGSTASYGIACSFVTAACSSSGTGALTGVSGTAYMYR